LVFIRITNDILIYCIAHDTEIASIRVVLVDKIDRLLCRWIIFTPTTHTHTVRFFFSFSLISWKKVQSINYRYSLADSFFFFFPNSQNGKRISAV
jgi:hypothetical protein